MYEASVLNPTRFHGTIAGAHRSTLPFFSSAQEPRTFRHQAHPKSFNNGHYCARQRGHPGSQGPYGIFSPRHQQVDRVRKEGESSSSRFDLICRGRSCPKKAKKNPNGSKLSARFLLARGPSAGADGISREKTRGGATLCASGTIGALGMTNKSVLAAPK